SLVYTTAIQADGKIIIGGGFSQYNGVAINRIARLNPDGSLDTDFNPGTGANSTVPPLSNRTGSSSSGEISILTTAWGETGSPG
ncbi:delta-60 repeat domain-containing protein, partial [Cecembia lonarensis]|uniref:delta-60 repeat domain-containing protein n=1 Tax=Cecembia lonarensis TaxID=645110 RepID=UPI001EE67822